jgi:ATP/maltotriose-dependent transcriptional regulator MalT
VVLQDSDLWSEGLEVSDEVEARARQLGEREQLAGARLGVITLLVLLGRWKDALERVAEADELGGSDFVRAELVETVTIRCERGELSEAGSVLDAFESHRNAEQAEFAAMFAVEEARFLRAQGRNDEAAAAAGRALAYRDELSVTNTRIKGALVEALEARFERDDLDGVAELLGEIETLQPGQLTPFLRAQRSRFRARLDARQGRTDVVDESFHRAAALLREFDCAFFLAATQLEHAEWLHAQGRPDEAEPLLAEARETFQRLEARPWLERAAQLAPHGEPETVAAQ